MSETQQQEEFVSKEPEEISDEKESLLQACQESEEDRKSDKVLADDVQENETTLESNLPETQKQETIEQKEPEQTSDEKESQIQTFQESQDKKTDAVVTTVEVTPEIHVQSNAEEKPAEPLPKKERIIVDAVQIIHEKCVVESPGASAVQTVKISPQYEMKITDATPESKLKYAEKVIEDIARLQFRSTSQLETLITILCHYVTNGEEAAYKDTLKKLDDLIKNSKKIKIRDINELAEEYEQSHQLFQAVIVYRCASVWYSQNNKPTKKNFLEESYYNALYKAKEAMEKFIIAEKCTDNKPLPLLIPILYEMLQILKEIQGPKKEQKAEKVAWSLVQIASIHMRLDQYKEAYDVTNKAIQHLEINIDGNASEYRVMGWAIYTKAGIALAMGKRDEAGKLMRSAIEATMEAKDFAVADGKKEGEKKRKEIADWMKKQKESLNQTSV